MYSGSLDLYDIVALLMIQKNRQPELLLPAGAWEQFQAGLLYGGDAFYLTVGDLSLRAAAQGFTWESLREAINLAHQQDKKIYFCLNIFAYEKHLASVRETLARLQDYAIDGLIIADPGILSLARKALPSIEIHLSTQANTSNSESVKFWLEQGVSRLNLARELSYREIRAVREACPDAELEVFVHGAMCVAFSGRCLMSAYLNQRSANLGACAHTCRYEYRPVALPLEESYRQGRASWELEEDHEFTRILEADDLCLVRYLNWFVAAGIDALKVEGRTKSSGYIAHAADTYKTALQDVMRGERRLSLYYEELAQAGSRPLTTGLFLGKQRSIPQITAAPKHPIFAQIIEPISDDKWLIQIKRKWVAGNDITIMLPGLQRPVISAGDYGIGKVNGEKLAVANPGLPVVLRLQHTELQSRLFLCLA